MSFKNTIIFGDSYSTFKGYIPSGYAFFYSEDEKSVTDVRNVADTWWHQLITETNSNLVLNDSWSGSTIGYTGYNNSDCSKTSSFIHRLHLLKDLGFFKKNKIDTVFVFGGTNDSWSNAPIGDPKYFGFENDDFYTVLPAISYFFKTLKDTLPDANIICIINTELKVDIAKGLKNACDFYEVKYICLEDIDKISGHPSVKGMTQIKNQILSSLYGEIKDSLK
ncbi:MAG: hypothetical protein E7562_01750 [Ruminococcaceae bacterium]|nr:hypothetical protein [Oscillospiraceae bacterium]